MRSKEKESDAELKRKLDATIIERHRRLELLERIASTSNGFQDLDGILRDVLDDVLELTGGSVGGILLMDKEPGVLYYRVQRGLSEKDVDEIRIPAGVGKIGSVIKTGEPVLIRDIVKDGALKLELGGAEHIRTVMAVPLKRRDDLAGVMVVASEAAGKFGDEELALLVSAGDYLATTVIRFIIVDRKISKGMARYQALLQYALGAQEDERKRIARELHDETSQTLTSLTFRLQAAIQAAETKGYGDARFKETLRKAQDCALQAGNEIVKLMMDLRPTLLDDLGMPAAIQRYAKDTLEARGISVTMESIGGEHRLPAEVEVALFRVAQGLISNILRHAEAKNVLIKIECDPGKAVLYIEDDGIGFDINKITDIEPNGRGAGLFTMRERLRLVGGVGDIESGPGEGTRITVTVPVIRDLEDLQNG